MYQTPVAKAKAVRTQNSAVMLREARVIAQLATLAVSLAATQQKKG